MGKLVLFLADGTLMTVPLDKERLTIGRRADNDVCLPYPAVSGEHAAVVTILADSFLEDLGSTNGTLVNGKPVLKHFLRDNDQIDIGRQRLTYRLDNDAVVEPLPPDVIHHQQLGLGEKVAGVRPPRKVSVGGRRAEDVRNAPLLADLDRQVEAAEMEGLTASMPAAPPAKEATAKAAPPDAALPVAASSGTRQAAASAGTTPRTPPPPSALAPSARASAKAVNGASSATGARTDALPVRVAARAARVDTDAAPDSGKAGPAPADGPAVRVLSGANAGRRVPFANDKLSVGRIGVQVALVRKVADGFRLIPLEGATPPRINGTPVAPEGAPLHPGDTFEIAGVRLELSLSP